MTLDQNYALQRVKGIKESFDNGVKDELSQYQDNRTIDFYNTTEVFEIFTSTEGLTGFKELGDLETPPSLALEDGYSVTVYEKRYGGAITLPEKVYRREGADNTLKVDTYLTRQRNQLMKDAVHKVLTDAFEFLNDGFDGNSYLAPDGKALFADDHEWSSGGTFNNETDAVLSTDAVDDVVEYGGDFTDPAGKPMPINFDTIIVKKGSPNSVTARKLFAEGIYPTKIADINIYEGTFTIIETPYISTANKANWFMRDSRLENSLKFGFGDYPTLREPQIEKNLSIYSPCTGFWKQGIVNMPYDWYGSDGSGSTS